MAEAGTTCPKCGKNVPANAAACPYDGTKLPWGLGDAPIEPTYISPKNSPRFNDAPTPQGEPAVFVDPAYTDETDRVIDPLIGAQLGDYVIRQRLGSGGMGIVYAGDQPLIGKRVAIKVLRPEIAADEKNVARLLAEARAVNSIRHRGIIDIFNFGKLPDGRNYIVMEYLAGEPLDAVVHVRGALPPLEVIDILNEILSALAAGHGAGIIHRDLKPSNIHVVAEPGGQKYIKVLDFGLAKSNMMSGKAMTHTNVVVGTPEYMAPEQARAEPVSPQSDLYALGIIAFELLTGRLPFSANAPFEWMMHQVNTPAPKPSSFQSGIPDALDALVLRLLAKKEANRPASADEVREELARIRKTIAVSESVVVPSGFREASGATGPKQAFTDEALAAARAQAAASRAPAPKQPGTKPAKPGHTGPRAAYAPNDGAAPRKSLEEDATLASPPVRDTPPEPKTLKASSTAPQRGDTILSPAVPSEGKPRPSGFKLPVVALLLALTGVASAVGGYVVYRQSLQANADVLQADVPQRDVAQQTPQKVDAKVETATEGAVEPKNETSTVKVVATNDTVVVAGKNTTVDAAQTSKKEPVVRLTRRAVLLGDVKSLNAKLEDPNNVRQEMGSVELVRVKLRAVKSQVNDAASDKDFDAAERQLKDIKKQHFR